MTRSFDDLLDHALALPQAERRAFVRERAGEDRELAARLEKVLAEAETRDGFLAPGAAMVGAIGSDLASRVEPEERREPPHLTPGGTFGAYEVIGILGRGGMGEVYRARDARLGRDVALKVLPERFALDPDRHARFEREARLLASLNHPRIGAIYELEDHEGLSALVLELVEGPTLAEAIAIGSASGSRLRATGGSRAQRGGGPGLASAARSPKPGAGLPLAEAIDVATQIADALEAAHQRGVVHRDLKPANIKITPDGDVKVLDFGIAKALGDDGDEAGPPVEATGDRVPGAILGTAPYLSPERARGLGGDHRADIWAFGCVVFEMLTGARAFGGASQTEVIARVLEREPDWSRLPERTPASLRRVLGRTLEKDPRRRLGFIGDARLDLEDARAELATPAPAASLPRAPRIGWTAALAAAAGLLAGGGLVWQAMRPAPPLVARLAVPVPATDVLVAGEQPGLAIAPDGRTLVYRARRDGAIHLMRRALDAADAEIIPGTENAGGPFFSPDGRWIGFATEGRLMKAPVDGGPPVAVCDTPGSPLGSWGDDGTIAFSIATARSIYTVPATGGDPVVVATPDEGKGELLQEVPEMLPGGRAALVTITYADHREVAVLRLDTGAVTPLTEGSLARFAPTGHVVFARGATLWAAPFDLGRLALAGEPMAVLEGVEQSSLSGTAHFAVGGDGSLVYMPPRSALDVRTPVWVDRRGAEEPLPIQPRPFTRVAISPRGDRVALALATAESRDIWIFERARGTLFRLTVDPAVDTAPVWSPDGRWIAFRSERESGGIFRMPSDGSAPAVRVTTTGGPSHTPYDVTGDGRTILFTELRNYTDQGIGQVPADGGAITWLVDGPFAEVRPALSPDGRWMAYQSDESGRYEVYVRPYPDVEAGRWLVSTAGGTSPKWSPDGRELFYYDGHDLVSVAIAADRAFSVGRPTPLFDATRFEERLGPVYDVLPDGRGFVMLRQGGLDGETVSRGELRFIQHWASEIREPATR